MNKKKFFQRSFATKKNKSKKFIGLQDVSKSRRISAFERGLVTWIDESYNPDSYLDGRVSDTGNKGVNFDD